MINISVFFLKVLKPYRACREMWLGRTARVEMNRWGDNGRLADGAKQQTERKNNWQGRQLVGAVGNGPGWQGIAGGECCEHQGQKHCTSEVYQCSQ